MPLCHIVLTIFADKWLLQAWCLYFRLNQLEEASSLAADFQSMRRDLECLLSESESKLNAVDTASSDNVEAMQNQLQEAKVTDVLFQSVLDYKRCCQHFYISWTIF